MTNETPATIRAWIDETFPNSSRAARIIKTKEELLELERALLAGDRAAQLEECADVAITICGWLEGVHDYTWDGMGVDWRAGESIADVWTYVDRGHGGAALETLFAYVQKWALGDLPAAINAKMAKNRKREWNIGADGTGQHVDKTSKSYLAGWSDAVVELGDDRDALARTVERVREWIGATVTDIDTQKPATTDYADGVRDGRNRSVRDLRAILDGKEG